MEEDVEVEISDAWYDAVLRARKAQEEINRIVAQEPERKHTPTNCWCGQSWDLRGSDQ